jgi:hypothetical protein
MGRPPFATTSTQRALVAGAVALALLGLGACGDGGGQAARTPDGGTDAADAEAAASAQADAADAADADDAADTASDDALDDASDGAAPDVGPGDHPMPPDVRAEAPADLPVERPSATASWTIGANPMCTAAGAGCMDTGAVGGYQITASGSCPTASDVQLWFPGGAGPVAAGSYAVKAADGILDVIAMPAGMVGVLAERDDGAGTHFTYWGRAGTVTVTAAGASRHVSFAGLSMRQEMTMTTMTTLAGDVTCP